MTLLAPDPKEMTPEELIRTPEEVLKEFQVIYHLEKKAAQVYHQLAQDCGNPEVGQLLEKIAGEERLHMRIAERLVQIAEKRVKEFYS